MNRSIFGQQPAMMHHTTPGTNFISGNHIEITIQQTHSTDNFVTMSPVAYQFTVESRSERSARTNPRTTAPSVESLIRAHR